MRSLGKQVQDVWFCLKSEANNGIDRVDVYSKPVHKRYTVSHGTGDISALGSGFNLDYDRQITCFNSDFFEEAKEGMMVFIDVTPKLDKFGNLATDNGEPITKPDYKCVKIFSTQKGLARRICVKKV